jgi:2-polyprenyl-3-methyl-5-hydroxy-6-metoxy-1,4-benzoquinol methylase
VKDIFVSEYFSGAALYGDDFDEPAIARWYLREQQGYYDLAQTYAKYAYSYHALNRFQSYRHLTGRYHCCLAMGCARGDDVAPLAPIVDRFVAIEPAEQWWSTHINGTAAEYWKPSVCGEIPMPGDSFDLVVCIETLHHIPNASHVLGEMARVLRRGGTMILREPICTMGDWRAPRRGLTPNERGFPPGWFDSQVPSLGLRVLRKRYCSFPLTTRLARFLCLGPAYNNRLLVRLDSVLSWLTKWNLHYHRDSIARKIAPTDVAYILQKV